MRALQADFRLLVNELLRYALDSRVTSRGTLSRFARTRALHYQITGTYAVVASGLALGLLRAHRQRLRRELPSRPPYVRRLFLRADETSFHLDRESGKVRLSLRRAEWASFSVHLAPYARGVLADPAVRLKQLHVATDRVVLYLERDVPTPYAPSALVALDTNERSLDGVVVGVDGTHPARIAFPEIARLQGRDAARRRRLARKKATDRRLSRRLLGREGRRERARVRSRLHVLTKRLVTAAARHNAAIALEDFSRLRRSSRRRGGAGTSRWRRGSGAHRGPELRRRLSSWPRAELHRQIGYKAAGRGVPIVWVNPFRTSTTCPRCGDYHGPRSRVGTTFVCATCGWRVDRQLNAGANVGRIALRKTAELGGLRLDLDALSREARRPRYPFRSVGRARAERTEREG